MLLLLLLLKNTLVPHWVSSRHRIRRSVQTVLIPAFGVWMRAGRHLRVQHVPACPAHGLRLSTGES